MVVQKVKDPALSLLELWFTAVVRVRSLARELLHVAGEAKKKRVKCIPILVMNMSEYMRIRKIISGILSTAFCYI